MTDLASIMPMQAPASVRKHGIAGTGDRNTVRDAFSDAVAKPQVSSPGEGDDRAAPVRAETKPEGRTPQRGLERALANLNARLGDRDERAGAPEEPSVDPEANVETVELVAEPPAAEEESQPPVVVQPQPVDQAAGEDGDPQDEIAGTQPEDGPPAPVAVHPAPAPAPTTERAAPSAAPVAAAVERPAARADDQRRTEARPTLVSTVDRTTIAPDTRAAAVEATDARSPAPAQSRQPVEPVTAATRDRADNDEPTMPRITIVATQSITTPAPTTGALPAPAQQLAAAMTADLAGRARGSDAAQAPAEAVQSRPAPMHSLTIQLQPVELGRVTARMVLVDGQLTVAISVENQEAQTRLSRDSDMLAGALRQAGYDVDRIVVQQAQQPASSGPGISSDRGGSSQDAGGGGAHEDGANRQSADRDQQSRAFRQPAADGGAEPGRAGVYI
jgi:hypothetical protein